MSESPDVVRVTGQLAPGELAGVESLVAAAARVDGVRALDEQASLHLGAPGSTHLLTGDRRLITGYARLERAADPDATLSTGPGRDDSPGTGTAPAAGTAPTPDAAADLVVHPDHRRRGLGRLLLDRLLEHAAGRAVQMWAHGPHPGAERLAAATGFVPVRELAWLRRPLAGPDAPPLPDGPSPAGVTIRTFRPGHDDDAWLALNAAAFAQHPEQGRWTRTDLDARLGAAWFDPAGFFVAERDDRPGQLVGFHWTKVHEGEVRGDGPGPVGEIYVLGVAPEAQGAGLAKALAVAGLRYLRDRGLRTVMLYVEADNGPAVGLYTRLGFAHEATDVMYRHP
ncbi:mycothiol synthase [Actinopolymorpha sp. B11F2]|uniref:mycothiol synthase n=1 Tax=Actinopolymorpha sp. B11F2 TaxID=3160862 RepID=UPI0032E4CA44